VNMKIKIIYVLVCLQPSFLYDMHWF